MLEIRVVRKIYNPTEEMLDAGEMDYDFIDDTVVNMSIIEFIDFLDRRGCGIWETSCSDFSRAWIGNDGVSNPYTRECEELSLHCNSWEDKQRRRWERYLKIAKSLRYI